MKIRFILAALVIAGVSCCAQELEVPGGGLHPGDEVILVLSARDLMLSLDPPQGLSARNVLTARVQEIEQNGHALWVIAGAGQHRLAVELTEEAGRELRLQAGTPVHVVFKSHSVIVSKTKR
jgi:molybdate transport system ATP-binding protein